MPLPDSAELVEWEARGSSPQKIKEVLSMLPVLTSKTTISIDGIPFGTNKGVDRQRNVDRNGIEMVDRIVPSTDESKNPEIEEAMCTALDSELGA